MSFQTLDRMGGGGGRGLASKYIKKKWSGLLHWKFKGD